MNAAALFGDLARLSNRMKMKRQEKKEQQDCRANKAARAGQRLHAENKHAFEPKSSFRCHAKCGYTWDRLCEGPFSVGNAGKGQETSVHAGSPENEIAF
jgi:hypothetical protein